ncbi:MAG: hypothetical protein ACOCWQ_06175 [Nanoarchaeota archaeon]
MKTLFRIAFALLVIASLTLVFLREPVEEQLAEAITHNTSDKMHIFEQDSKESVRQIHYTQVEIMGKHLMPEMLTVPEAERYVVQFINRGNTTLRLYIPQINLEEILTPYDRIEVRLTEPAEYHVEQMEGAIVIA